MPSGRPGRWLYDMQCLQHLTEGARMEVRSLPGRDRSLRDPSLMTPADTARRLLVDAAGEPLCDACLAFACSISLGQMRRVTERLLTHASFHRRDSCVSCRRTVPAIAFAAKCVHCSRPVLPGEDALEIEIDMFHAACLRRIASDQTIRLSKKLSQESRRRIEDSLRRIDRQAKPPDAAAS